MREGKRCAKRIGAGGGGVFVGRGMRGEGCARGRGVGRGRKNDISSRTTAAVPISRGGAVGTTIPMMWSCAMHICGGACYNKIIWITVSR